MNLRTASGLALEVEDLTAFAADDRIVCESWSRLVVGGLIEFTSWTECYETFTLTAPVRSIWPEIEAALDAAACEEYYRDMEHRAYVRRLAEERGIHGF